MNLRKLFTEIEQANVILLNEFHPKMSVGIMSESGLFLNPITLLIWVHLNSMVGFTLCHKVRACSCFALCLDSL
jgi:hypothetical protein